MASAGDRYLPELAKCFAGEAIVFSWSETAQALTENVKSLSPHVTNALISSSKIKTILSQKVPTFPPPSQQSRSQFETKTAAINVTPSNEKSYDIDEIKKNTLWLSEEVKVAEEEALRITTLEWQQQPAKRLTEGYSDAELASLQEALGERDTYAGSALNRVFPKRNDDDFDTAEKKRKRLLAAYFTEQVGLLVCARRLQELAILDNDGSVTTDNLGQFAREVDPLASTDTGIYSITKAVESRLKTLEAGKSWSIADEDINNCWIASELQCIQALQEILFLRLRGSSELVATETLLNWLEIMAGCDFYATVEPGPLLPPSQVESLQAMSALTTLAMLDPATTLSSLSEPSTSVNPTSYFLQGDAAHDLHQILLSAAESCLPQAGPSALAWALILGEIKRQAVLAKETRESGAVQRAIDQISTYDTATGRRTSSGSFQQSIYEDVLSTIMNTSDISDPATYLLRCTIEAAHVFDSISILAKEREYRSALLSVMSLQLLQELISIAVSSIGYTSEILVAQFSTLATHTTLDTSYYDARETFIKNDFLMDSIFGVAAGRFPYESLPYLRLCKLLASAKIFDEQGTQYITFRLRTMDSFTQNAIGSYSSYHTVREDENLNLVALDATVSMFQGFRKKMLSYGQATNEISVIPSDTLGEVISESIPPVIKWQHSYSGLALLGAWIELHYLGQLQNLLSPHETTEEVITETVAILTTLLKNTIDSLPKDKDENDRRRLQDELLDEASAFLQADSDVADYVFEILEQELQAYRRRPSNTFNTSVLVACINFVAVYSQVRPDQFWPSFAKSSLLDSYGSDSFLLSITSGVEVPNRDFSFLSACIELYQSIIKGVLHQSSYEPTRTKTKRVRTFQPQSLRLHANTLSSMTQSMYSAFEAIPTWIFTSSKQQSSVVTSLAKSFTQVITYSSAIEKSTSSLNSSFVPASDFIIQQVGFGTDELSSTTAILRHIFRIHELRKNSDIRVSVNQFEESLQSLLELSIVLVRLGKFRAQTTSILDRQLLDILPLLCRTLVSPNPDNTVNLITSLLDTVGQSGTVSLLGHLGSSSAIAFLEILKFNIGEWASDTSKSCTWDLLARLVGKNQQWLAIVILTGSPPDRVRRDGDEQVLQKLRGKTFMEVALKQLVKIIEINQNVTISMLKFVIRAQMNWSWANEAMKSNKDFLPSILSYVCNTFVEPNDDLKISYRNKIAAMVTDLSTIHLHHAKANRDTTTLKTIIPLLKWLASNAIDVANYKHSLHTNLRKNFASKFSGLELNDFKRTTLLEPHYGDDYYYDLSFANEILRHEPQWDRTDRYRDQSFSAELRRANLNLSVVDSEVKLLNSFLNLCIEHSGYFAKDPEVQPTVIEIVKSSLVANTQAYPPEKIFENVLQTRADMSTALLQRLVDYKARGAEVRSLLRPAWECTRANNGSFEQAIVNNDLAYWRSMLTIILMTLQFQVDKRYMPPAADQTPAALLRHTEQAITTILEIVTVVVGQGMRSVTVTLQDQRQSGSQMDETSPALVTHKDVYLILTIFETILRMTRLPEFISEASIRLIAEGAIQSTLLLYSWSHVLTGPDFDNEPIYAGYALQFLTSLSSLPPVTEELAVEGILSRLLSARITQKLQAVQDGAGHIDKRPQVQAMYNLWATGILPICLNLLSSVGAPVAAEVSIFINQFPNQLNRASVAFIPSQSRTAATDSVTFIVAEEATTLALISYILSSFRNAGASAAVDPSTIQPLIGYDEHKKALSEDISDIVSATTTSLKTKVVATNEKEAALAREENGEGLVKKIVTELQNALTCLKGQDAEDDK